MLRFGLAGARLERHSHVFLDGARLQDRPAVGARVGSEGPACGAGAVHPGLLRGGVHARHRQRAAARATAGHCGRRSEEARTHVRLEVVSGLRAADAKGRGEEVPACKAGVAKRLGTPRGRPVQDLRARGDGLAGRSAQKKDLDLTAEPGWAIMHANGEVARGVARQGPAESRRQGCSG